MRRLFISVMILMAVLLLPSCGPYQEVTVSGVKDFRVKKLDMKGIDAEIDVVIDNPNKIGFKVFRSRAKVIVAGMQLGDAVTTRNVRIPARSNKVHTFTLKGNFEGFSLSNLSGILSGKGSLIELNGYIKAGKLFYRKKFPVSYKQKMPSLGN